MAISGTSNGAACCCHAELMWGKVCGKVLGMSDTAVFAHFPVPYADTITNTTTPPLVLYWI